MDPNPVLLRRCRCGRDHLPALRRASTAGAVDRTAGQTHRRKPARLVRDGDTLELEADHRHHAVVEDAIRDLKYGVGLNHLPSGRFGVNAAWLNLNLNVSADNLARWTSRIDLGETLIATDTPRRRHLRTPGRLPRSGRKLTLHLPKCWPWAEYFTNSFARLRTSC